MSGKIILNLAISLDGYIADETGGFDWIHGHGSNALDTENDHDFGEFRNSIDVAVMGYKSYEQGKNSYVRDYQDKKVYVATNSKQENYDNITFINGNITEIILKERDKGKIVYLFGGGVLIDPFIKENIIDEYIVGVIPTILGSGRPLFLGNNPVIPLNLKEYSIRDGIINLKYVKR